MKRRLALLVFLTSCPSILIAQVNPFSVSEAGLDYLTGQALFEKVWVSAPASTQASDGLGPLYNARSCAQCHVEAGKGTVEESLILRVNHPEFGQQLQTRGVPGLPAEAQVTVTYEVVQESLADGTVIELQQPRYVIQTEAELTEFSARVAPSLAGIGVLANIPQFEIMRRADTQDRNSDGISGRYNLALFGWKAGTDSLADQVGLALSLDIGISSPLYQDPYGDCTQVQQVCLSFPHGASEQHQELEIGLEAFYSLVNFVRQIPAPLARQDYPAGEEIFNELGCAACHVSGYANGSVNPYTDLLLHDMGPALADNMNNALSQEWRTPSLWGLGTYAESETQHYLHDGRARSLVEAILWHGGEADAARQAFAVLTAAEREDLMMFLQGL